VNEATASIVRTFIKSAAVVIIFLGWPKFGKSHVFNQTVIQPSEADDLVMRSVILELSRNQPSDRYIYFLRSDDADSDPDATTDRYTMLRSDWEKAGKPDSISVTVSSLISEASV